MKYFSLSNTEDGLILNTFKDKSTLLDYLQDRNVKFIDEVPIDLEYMDCDTYIILKGDIVVPTPVNIVKSYDVS